MSIAWTVLDRKLPILLTDKLHDAESPQKSTCAAFMWSRRGLLTWNKTGMQPDLPRMSATPAALGSQFGQAVWASSLGKQGARPDGSSDPAAHTLCNLACSYGHLSCHLVPCLEAHHFHDVPALQDHNTRVMKLG